MSFFGDFEEEDDDGLLETGVELNFPAQETCLTQVSEYSSSSQVFFFLFSFFMNALTLFLDDRSDGERKFSEHNNNSTFKASQ
jgi:hypothetical protein